MLELAREIVRCHLNGDFRFIIVYGRQRVGKTAYVIKSMNEALNFLYGTNLYKTYKEDLSLYMGWHPLDVTNYWLNLVEKIPCYTWDDAGMWLFALDWQDPILQSIIKYLNVVGTDISVLILTTPEIDWVLSKIRKMEEIFKIKIMKARGSKKLAMLTDSVRFARLAKAYKPWSYPDGKGGGVNLEFADRFSCKLPQPLYDFYNPIRELYADIAKRVMKDAILNRMKSDPLYSQAHNRYEELLEKVKV